MIYDVRFVVVSRTRGFICNGNTELIEKMSIPHTPAQPTASHRGGATPSGVWKNFQCPRQHICVSIPKKEADALGKRVYSKATTTGLHEEKIYDGFGAGMISFCK